MNQEQFITIMQSAMLSFIDKLNEEEILALKPDYSRKAIEWGIKLAAYLKAKEIE